MLRLSKHEASFFSNLLESQVPGLLLTRDSGLCLGPHSRKTIDRCVQVAREIGGGLGADVERGAGIFFHREHRGQRHLFEMLDQRFDAGVQFLMRHDVADETECQRFVRVDLRGRVDHISCGLARHAIDQRGKCDGGHDAVRRLGKLKARSVAGDGDVAQRGEGATEADGAALHDADNRRFGISESTV